MKFLKSVIPEVIVIAGLFVVAASEGKAYPIAGIFAILYLATIAFRYFIKN